MPAFCGLFDPCILSLLLLQASPANNMFEIGISSSQPPPTTTRLLNPSHDELLANFQTFNLTVPPNLLTALIYLFLPSISRV